MHEMIRHVLLCWVLVAAIFPANTEAAKPLASLDLDLTRLKTWGTRTYTYEVSLPGSNEKSIIGRIVLNTELAADCIVLHDSMVIRFGGKKLSLDLEHRCRKDSFLSPLRIESKGEGDDELGTFVATINNEKAIVRSEDGERGMAIPHGVVTASALFRLVTLLARTRGDRVSFDHWLESEELNLKKNFVVECTGVETIPWKDEDVTCTKFRLTGGGNHPAYYWVDDDDVLRQVLIDGRGLMRLTDDPDNGK
jgi:hypothetical protein